MGINRNLLESIHIHKIIKVTVCIEILHFAAFNISVFKLIGRAECTLRDSAGNDIFYFSADKGGAFTRLHVLEFDNLTDLSIHFKSNTVAEIAGSDHRKTSIDI